MLGSLGDICAAVSPAVKASLGAVIKGKNSHVADFPVQEYETVIRPAVSGVENVFRAVDESPSVERVVMTSSVGAVVGHHWERGRDHVYTEADWNQTATETFLPYHRYVAASADDHTGL